MTQVDADGQILEVMRSAEAPASLVWHNESMAAVDFRAYTPRLARAALFAVPL